MLVVPMQNREGETIGVLQLINKKPDSSIRLSSPDSFEKNVLPFTSIDEQLVSSLASQAAISVENNALYNRIGILFDDFVEASVMAIESRDPVTRGHSRRVARMTVELARVTHCSETGPYRELRLSEEEIRELKYAALLHDFGKVGVKERVLQKENKLLSGELALVGERFQTIRRTVEVEHLRRMMERLMRRDGVSADEIQSFEKELARDLAGIDRAWEEIQAANQPTVTHFSIDTERLEELGSRFVQNPDGSRRRYLKPDEVLALKISRGTLTEVERKQIQTHVVHTYEFLSKIPWTRDLQNIPKLARGHHEKLDGSGYPYGLAAPEIPPQTRMMTISDIFDALAAQDRPYKPRVPTDRALDILREEAREGQLDPELLELFIEAKVFRFAD
jgi:HD-GYP domain-containing protein (c-di-GMP phosphodiesterase class II)